VVVVGGESVGRWSVWGVVGQFGENCLSPQY
jgi:hypothetical protein